MGCQALEHYIINTMARPLRIDAPGLWHHVYLRGARRAPIFGDNEDARGFLDLLETASERYRLEVHAYSLMPNHYHLLLRSQRGLLSRGMAFLNGMFTKGLNARHGRWDGPVFRGRFQSKLVQTEDYLQDVLVYIHLNPVAARLVKRPDDECWTSHRAYMGLEQRPAWLHVSHVLALTGGRELLDERMQRIIQGADEWPAQRALDLASFWREREVEELEDLEDFAAPELEDVLLRVAAVTGVTRKDLPVAIRGRRGNPARRFAAWALSVETTLTQATIGEQLGMSPAQVAQVLGKVRRGEASKEIEAWRARWVAENATKKC